MGSDGFFKPAQPLGARSDHWTAEREYWKWLCQIHVAHLRSGLQLASPPMPMVDAGYFLGIAVGEAVLSSDGPFVMGTIGAMLGHWAARAATMSQRRARPSHLYVAEVERVEGEGEEWFCGLLLRAFLEDLHKPALHCRPPSLASLSQWLEDQVT